MAVHGMTHYQNHLLWRPLNRQTRLWCIHCRDDSPKRKRRIGTEAAENLRAHPESLVYSFERPKMQAFAYSKVQAVKESSSYAQGYCQKLANLHLNYRSPYSAELYLEFAYVK